MQERIINEFNDLVSGANRKELRFVKGYKEYEDIYTSFKKYEWFNELIERVEEKQHGHILVILKRREN